MERTALAQSIRKLRESHCKLNQTDFADLVGVSRVAISRYETGVRVPTRSTLARLKDLASEQGYHGLGSVESVPDAYGILSDIAACVLSAGECRITNDEQFKRILNYLSKAEGRS